MQFCQPHWDALRKAVEDRGMWHLVAKSGQAAMGQLVAQVHDQDNGWDPLMAAHWAISARVLQNGGLDILFGEVCPLCEVQKSFEWWNTNPPRPPEASDAQEWINGCMDAMLEYAREHGLLKRRGWNDYDH